MFIISSYFSWYPEGFASNFFWKITEKCLQSCHVLYFFEFYARLFISIMMYILSEIIMYYFEDEALGVECKKYIFHLIDHIIQETCFLMFSQFIKRCIPIEFTLHRISACYLFCVNPLIRFKGQRHVSCVITTNICIASNHFRTQ